MNDGRQRQRHGVHKNLAEGIGGVLVGAALVLLLRQLLARRQSPARPSPPAPGPAGGEAPARTPAP